MKKWREKIAYAESDNLVRLNLSLGQKQLIDLQETLHKDKEIYIFDEVDNNLDKNNKSIIKEKMEMLGRKKIVIIMKVNN